MNKRTKYKILIRLRRLGFIDKKPVYKKPVIKIRATIYPDGKPRMSPNGTGEWYGIIGD